MKKFLLKNCMEHLHMLGRTYYTREDTLYFNWTCSGVRFGFTGSSLAISVNALPAPEQELDPMTGTFHTRDTWPWIAVFLDDGEEPYRYFELDRPEAVYPVFVSEQEEHHTITIRKMTENAKGKACLKAFVTDGEIYKPREEDHKLKIEFIGDSITCGFGNMVNDANRMFYTVDENGWMSHAAIAARKLQADFSIVSCSGIAISDGIGAFEYALPSMRYFYPYRDRMAEEIGGTAKEPLLWDFEKHKPNIIVLNLGTNDATVIDLNGDTAAGVARFEKDYYDFLQLLRKHNGKEPWIICALGSMDYFLYDNIQKVAAKYCDENHDERISCFKYGRVRVNDGLGACRHPYVTTQIRMGEELAAYIEGLDLNKK